MTKAKDLRDQTIEELLQSLEEARKRLFLLRNEFSQGTNAEQPHRRVLLRKDIARLLTVIHQKQTVARKCAI